MQGLWIEALAGLAELAASMHDQALASQARAATREVSRRIGANLLAGRIAASTRLRRRCRKRSRPSPSPGHSGHGARSASTHLSTRAADRRGHGAASGAAVVADARRRSRAQLEIDHLGSGALATDWGTRMLSNRSELYDPLSYHYGSVWPLFTGWASMAAYRYGRPHVGYQALTANALLTFDGALGYVTELLSGDFNAAFGRSSHHQIWSEAMVVTPFVRGLLGIEVTARRTRAALRAATAGGLGPRLSRQDCRRRRRGTISRSSAAAAG